MSRVHAPSGTPLREGGVKFVSGLEWGGRTTTRAKIAHLPSIRRAAVADARACADIQIAAMRTSMPWLPDIHTDEETRAWMRDVVFATREVWVAEESGLVDAFVAIENDVVGNLYVRPDAQRRGLGSALLDVVKRERPHGFRLWVFQKNAAARAFYESRGLVCVETTDGRANEEREPDALYAWTPGDSPHFVTSRDARDGPRG
jgi:GNAT superfamily N-acetyltransferase